MQKIGSQFLTLEVIATPSLSGGPQETAPRIAKKRTLWAVRSELMLGHAGFAQKVGFAVDLL